MLHFKRVYGRHWLILCVALFICDLHFLSSRTITSVLAFANDGIDCVLRTPKQKQKRCQRDTCVKKSEGCAKASGETQCFFSPDDQIQIKVIDLIKTETKSIKVAIYQFTDKKIAQAIIDAWARGVDIELVVDPAACKSPFSKVSMIKAVGVTIFEYDPKNKFYNLMHHKFAIFESNELLLTGSFNWTRAANQDNQENVVLIYDKAVIARFARQFELLKDRCVDQKIARA